MTTFQTSGWERASTCRVQRAASSWSVRFQRPENALKPFRIQRPDSVITTFQTSGWERSLTCRVWRAASSWSVKFQRPENEWKPFTIQRPDNAMTTFQTSGWERAFTCRSKGQPLAGRSSFRGLKYVETFQDSEAG
jgi:hypothetical protein